MNHLQLFMLCHTISLINAVFTVINFKQGNYKKACLSAFIVGLSIFPLIF